MAFDAAHKPAASKPSPPGRNHRWLTLAVISVVQLMLVLDLTIVNIALPRAQHDLGFADSGRQWIVTAYTLSFGSLLLPFGRLGDLIGRKHTLIVGLIGFSAASIVGGAAPNFATLVTARAVQGGFGALLAPSILGLLSATFSVPRDRQRAFAVFGAVAGAAGAIGVLLGGVLTSYASWRWCLYVNVMFAAVAIAGGLRLLPNSQRNRAVKLDLVGTALASAGLFGVVFGFSQAEPHGWATANTVIPLSVGVVLLVAFLFSQRLVPHPLLPLRIPGDRTRGGACLVLVMTNVGIFTMFLFLTFYLQNVRGYSPVRTGLAFVPVSLGIFVSSAITNTRLLPRFGSRTTLCFGLTLAGLGLLWLTQLQPNSAYSVHVLPSLIISGLGFGALFGPGNNAVTTAVHPNEIGAASALANTMQQVGASFGISLMSTLAAGATTRYLQSHPAQQTDLTSQAAVHGFVVVFALSAVILFATAIAGGLLIRAKTATGAPKR